MVTLLSALATLLLAGPAPGSATELPDLTRIDGGTRGSKAADVTTGRFLDRTEKSGDFNFYRITRTVPGSTIMFGSTLLRDDGFDRANRLSMVLALLDKDGSVVRCGKAENTGNQRTTVMPLVTHAGYSLNERPGCRGRSELLLAVYANGVSKIPAGTPYELDIWQVPPVENLDRLPPSGFGSTESVQPTEPTTQVEPGAWMAEAPLLTADESVHVDLPLGRVTWFAVEVGFDQMLDVLATVSDPARVDGGSAVEIRVVSPVGGVVGVPSVDADRFQEIATIADVSVTVESRSYLVSPAARVETDNTTGFDGEKALNGQPGVYYVALYAADVNGADDTTVPVTLTPGVLRGTGLLARGQDPSYASDVSAFPAPDGPEPTAYDADTATQPTPSSTPPTEPSATGVTAGGGPSPVVVGVLAALGLLAGGAGGVVWLLSRRRGQPSSR